jgi:RNA polymerase sigma-70 factor (ECF subfamily)
VRYIAPVDAYLSRKVLYFAPLMQDQRTEQLARLWTEAQPMVAAYILSLIPDFHRAEDVLQQVAVVLVRRFDEYEPGRPFLPWALGIARNASFDCRREMAKVRSPLLNDELIESVREVFEEESDASICIRQALRTCLQGLRERMLEVLQLRYAEDLKPQDVAKRLGITSGSVRVILHRARQGLRACIERSTRASL